MEFLKKIIKKKNQKQNDIEIDKINNIKSELIKCENIQEYINNNQDQIANKIKAILKENLIFNQEKNIKINRINKFSEDVIRFFEKEEEITNEIINFTKILNKVRRLEKIEQKEQNDKLIRQRDTLIKKRESLIQEEKELNLKLEDINYVLDSLVQICLKER